jgi:hypothetical protein
MEIRANKAQDELIQIIYMASCVETVKCIEGGVMGGKCSAYGKDQKWVKIFGKKTRREEIPGKT